MNRVPHIVITRAKKLKGEEALGWEFTHHDFIQKSIEIPGALSSKDISPNIALTSKTGVQAFMEIINRLQLEKSSFSVFSIAHATKEFALRSGLHVKGDAPDATSLAKEIASHRTLKTITHVTGNLRRPELKVTLNKAGVEVTEIVAYRTELTPISITEQIDGIVFFSPSAVDSLLLANSNSDIPCFCIGQTTACHAKQKGFKTTYAPNAPTEEALINLLNDHFSKSTVHAQK